MSASGRLIMYRQASSAHSSLEGDRLHDATVPSYSRVKTTDTEFRLVIPVHRAPITPTSAEHPYCDRTPESHAIREYHEAWLGYSCGAFAVITTAFKLALKFAARDGPVGYNVSYVDINVIPHLFVSVVPLPTRPFFLSALQLRPF